MSKEIEARRLALKEAEKKGLENFTLTTTKDVTDSFGDTIKRKTHWINIISEDKKTSITVGYKPDEQK